MSFRRDKLMRRRRRRIVLIGILFGIAVILLFIFGSKPLVSTGYRVATPFWQVSSQIGEQTQNIAERSFSTKRELLKTIDELNQKIRSDRTALLRAEILEKENSQFREALGNIWPDESWLVAGILVRPPHTPYDVLVLDVGEQDGVLDNQLVFSSTGAILGVVKEVLKKQSFVTLLSTPGITTDVIIESYGVAVSAEGRGGGVYEVHVPRDVEIIVGDQVVLPGRQTEVLGQIREIIFDPRDPFQVAFVSAPVNFYEQRFMYVSDRTLADVPDVETVVLEVINDDESVATSTEE